MQLRQISTKLVLSVTVVTTLVVALIMGALFGLLITVEDKENQRVALLRSMNDDLRAQLFTLQDTYFALPGRLHPDTGQMVSSWAHDHYDVTETRHQGGDAVARR